MDPVEILYLLGTSFIFKEWLSALFCRTNEPKAKQDAEELELREQRKQDFSKQSSKQESQFGVCKGEKWMAGHVCLFFWRMAFRLF